ncbi:MAG: hypothetical protein ACPGXK_00285 [Phycisphaerae bacterium]
MSDDRSNDTKPLTLEQLEAEKIQQMHDGPPPKKAPRYTRPSENENPGVSSSILSKFEGELIYLVKSIGVIALVLCVIVGAALVLFVTFLVLSPVAIIMLDGLGVAEAIATLLLSILVSNAILIALIYWIAKPKWNTKERTHPNQAAGGSPHTRAT